MTMITAPAHSQVTIGETISRNWIGYGCFRYSPAMPSTAWSRYAQKPYVVQRRVECALLPRQGDPLLDLRDDQVVLGGEQLVRPC